MTLDEARKHIGNKAVYRAPHVGLHEPGEEGVITSVNERWVFVRYLADPVSKATPPECLTPVR
jgi:hypothetical protein